MTDLSKIAVRYSPLSQTLMLCRFGKDPRIALDRREVTGEVMRALVEYMLTDGFEKGASLDFWVNGEGYTATLKPNLRPQTEMKAEML